MRSIVSTVLSVRVSTSISSFPKEFIRRKLFRLSLFLRALKKESKRERERGDSLSRSPDKEQQRAKRRREECFARARESFFRYGASKNESNFFFFFFSNFFFSFVFV